MDFFLPVAQVQVSILVILLLSFIVGIISGLFGIGGGFLMTPVLIFLGIPPAYAVANEANNILGTSVSGGLVSIESSCSFSFSAICPSALSLDSWLSGFFR